MDKQDGFRMLRNIRKRRFLFAEPQIKLIVNSLTICKLDYCNAILYGISEGLLHELQLLQNAAAKTVMGLYKYDHVGDSLQKLHWLPVKFRIMFKILILVYKCLNGMGPNYLTSMLSYENYGHVIKLKEPVVKTSFGERAFSKAGPKLWNSLPNTVTHCTSLTSFKSHLKTHLFRAAFNLCE